MAQTSVRKFRVTGNLKPTGLKHFLANYPNEFAIEGAKGCTGLSGSHTDWGIGCRVLVSWGPGAIAQESLSFMPIQQALDPVRG